jgi:hypothetical protein
MAAQRRARLTEDDAIGVKAGDVFTEKLFSQLLVEEYEKLRRANNRDVHDNSKDTTLPIAREIVDTYVRDAVKLPCIDLLNVNLGNFDLQEANGGLRCCERPSPGGAESHRKPRLRADRVDLERRDWGLGIRGWKNTLVRPGSWLIPPLKLLPNP